MDRPTAIPNAHDATALLEASLQAPIVRVGLLSLLLVLGVSRPTAAQMNGLHPPAADSHDGTVDVTTVSWRSNFDDQVARLLRSDPKARMPALNDVIQVARRDETNTDLSATVAPLIKVAYSDPKLERRLKAVEALQYIGADGVLTSLQRTVVDAVIGFFGGGPAAECSSAQRQA